MAGPEVFAGINQFAFGQFHVSPAELDDMILVHGSGAELRRGVLCPCQRIETRQPRVRCPVCRGVGWSYPEGQRAPVIVLLLSRNARQRDLAAGRSYSGTAECTFPRGTIPARGDIVAPDGEVHVVQEVVHRAVAQVSAAAIRARALTSDVLPTPQQPAAADALLYSDIVAVESITYLTEDGGTLVTARPVVDYTIAGNLVSWKPGAGPAPGSAFTARYRANAQYVVGDAAPVARAEHGNDYPYKASLARLDQWSALGSDQRVP